MEWSKESSGDSCGRAERETTEDVLEAYRRPFAGLSDEEMMVLDGIILEPVSDE